MDLDHNDPHIYANLSNFPYVGQQFVEAMIVDLAVRRVAGMVLLPHERLGMTLWFTLTAWNQFADRRN